MVRYYPYLVLKVFCIGNHLRYSKLFILLFISIAAFGQNETEYEEVPVTFSYVPVGTMEITAIIKNEQAYLPIKTIFDFLKIKTNATTSLDSIQGFFIDPKSSFLFDFNTKHISYSGKQIELSASELIKTPSDLYLSSFQLNKIFGLDCQFNFRHLSISLKTEQELPVLRELKQKKLLDNLSHLKDEKKADTIIKSKFKWIQLGMADWSINATQERNRPDYLRANVAMGAMLLGGEANVNLTHYKGQRFDAGSQFYRWRYVNNKLSLFNQIAVGRISIQNISSLSGPLNGIVISNTPTNYRKAFGSYHYTGTTEPGWVVELYVNSILVNYIKADATGFFSFDIPIVYGNSAIELKFYGPWGEEKIQQENISIPYSFLPAGKMEYSLGTGIVKDENKSRFSRLNLSYGLNKRITIGGGTEYLSSVMPGKAFPYFNASMRLGNSLIFNGELAKGVRTKGAISYRSHSALQMEIAYMKYAKGQIFINNNYQEERRFLVTIPFRYKRLSAYSRLSYNEFILSKYKYSSTEWLLSASVRGISSNLKTSIQTYQSERPTVYSNYSLSFRIPGDVRLSPQAQYQYNSKRFTLLKIEGEKKISYKGYLNMAFEKSSLLHYSTFSLGLRFDLSFGRVFLSTRQGSNTMVTTQSASGNLTYGRGPGLTRFSNQNNLGRGGLIVSPFLDLNSNGKKDANEPKVNGLKLKVNGGRIEQIGDSHVMITSLEAYKDYIIELDKNSFDNIAWQIKKASLKVTVQPNVLQLIEVPVEVMGEASGMVFLDNGKQLKGLSRIQLNFYDSSFRKVGQTLSETDGYFSFMGLSPGRYQVKVDSTQMEMLRLNVFPGRLSFTIKESVEGVLADGFEFKLKSRDTTKQVVEISQSKTLEREKFGGARKNTDLVINGTSVPVEKNPNIKNNRIIATLPTVFKPTGKISHQSATLPNSLQMESAPYMLRQMINRNARKMQGRVMKGSQVALIKSKIFTAKVHQDNRERYLHVKLLKLIKEQQELIQKQKQLLREIYKLRLQILNQGKRF
jgi:hypothetical protein